MSVRPTETIADQDDLLASYRVLTESFRRKLLAENKSPRTIQTYGEALRLFGEHLAAAGMPTEVGSIRRDHVESFIAGLLERFKPATASNRYRALKVFFKWLVDEGELRRSPMERMQPPRVPEDPPKVLSDDGRSPRSFLGAVRDPLLVAFSTSSSAAAMPLSMRAAESGLGVRPEIARFVVPLGATVNMAGTALYQVVATLFLTQVFGIALSPGELALLTATVVGASIGSPSTPGVGIVMLATILQGAGIPTSGIALVIGVDRVLDMARTTLNVTGDLAACVIMDRWMPATPPQ